MWRRGVRGRRRRGLRVSGVRPGPHPAGGGRFSTLLAPGPTGPSPARPGPPRLGRRMPRVDKRSPWPPAPRGLTRAALSRRPRPLPRTALRPAAGLPPPVHRRAGVGPSLAEPPTRRARVSSRAGARVERRRTVPSPERASLPRALAWGPGPRGAGDPRARGRGRPSRATGSALGAPSTTATRDGPSHTNYRGSSTRRVRGRGRTGPVPHSHRPSCRSSTVAPGGPRAAASSSSFSSSSTAPGFSEQGRPGSRPRRRPGGGVRFKPRCPRRESREGRVKGAAPDTAAATVPSCFRVIVHYPGAKYLP